MVLWARCIEFHAIFKDCLDITFILFDVWVISSTKILLSCRKINWFLNQSLILFKRTWCCEIILLWWIIKERSIIIKPEMCDNTPTNLLPFSWRMIEFWWHFFIIILIVLQIIRLSVMISWLINFLFRWESRHCRSCRQWNANIGRFRLIPTLSAKIS